MFTATPLSGAYLLQPEPASDERGYFARWFCAREFEARGLDPRLVQCSVSYNRRAGTLRGLHYQVEPHAEAKTIRCLQGRVFDVIVDLRPESATRHQWYAVELSAAQGNALHVPAGFAHGFLTLEPESTLEYLISSFHVPEAARGIRYDDPTLAIRWPASPVIISDRDRGLPTLPTS